MKYTLVFADDGKPVRSSSDPNSAAAYGNDVDAYAAARRRSTQYGALVAVLCDGIPQGVTNGRGRLTGRKLTRALMRLEGFLTDVIS